MLIGGDLNTSTVSRDWARGTGVKPVLPEERVLDPVPFEPMFEVAAAHGYDWRACNALNVPTQRTRPDGTPAPPLGKIDWFLCRGLLASDRRHAAGRRRPRRGDLGSRRAGGHDRPPSRGRR